MTKTKKLMEVATFLQQKAITLTEDEAAFIAKYGITHQHLTGADVKVIGVTYQGPEDHHSTVTPEDIAAMESIEAKFADARIIHISIKEKSNH